MLELSIQGRTPNGIICLNLIDLFLGSVLIVLFVALDMSKKAALYGQVFAFALRRRVERRNMASSVLLFLQKPNWSGPIRSFFSAGYGYRAILGWL